MLSGITYNAQTFPDDIVVPDSVGPTFTGGTTFTGANASIGNSAILYWNQTGTLTGKAITFGNYGRIYNNTAGGSLTLGAGTALTGGVSVYFDGAGSVVANQGTITQTNNQSYGYLYAPTFDNEGTITNNAGTMYFGSSNGSYTTTNKATGQVAADGANTYIYLDGTVVNQGVMEARNGGNLVFRYNNTTANLGTLQIGAGGGRVLLNGTLTNTAATINAISGGVLELYGGTINNGTIAAGALGFTSSGGTLNNVSYTGNLAMADSTSAIFTGGTTFTGANASLGNSAILYWNQTGALTGKAITFGNYGRIYNNSAGGSLSLGAGTALTGGVSVYFDGAGSVVTNQGTITQTNNQSYGYLYAPTFDNEGTITNNAGTMYFGSSNASYTTTNKATGQVAADGANTYVYLDGTVVNQGVMEARNGGNLVFRYNNTTANLGTLQIGAGGGRVLLNGTLNNTAATINAIGGGVLELYGGTINNGTIASGALGFTSSGGYLNAVTVNGDLALASSSGHVYFQNGTTFSGTNLNLAANTGIYWQQSGTLSNKVITQGSGAYIYLSGANRSLTIDSTTTVTGDASVYTDSSSGSAITNQGTLTHNINTTGQLSAENFTNTGTIAVSTGSLYLGYYSDESTTNAAGGVINLTGGNIQVYSPMSNAGQINVQSGTLYTNSYLTNTAGGLIKGAGTIYGDLTMAGGTLAPGNSIGTLTFTGSSDFIVSSASTLEIELDATSADKMVFQNPGTINLGAGLLQLSIVLLSAPTPYANYTLLDITSGGTGISGFLAGLPNNGDGILAYYAGDPYAFHVSYLANQLVIQAVPEPGTYALMGAGLAVVALLRRRRKVG